MKIDRSRPKRKKTRNKVIERKKRQHEKAVEKKAHKTTKFPKKHHHEQWSFKTTGTVAGPTGNRKTTMHGTAAGVAAQTAVKTCSVGSVGKDRSE